VALGLAAPVDRWCPGCVLFVQIAEELQYELDQEAARRNRARR
jgi:hypothetical protein